MQTMFMQISAEYRQDYETSSGIYIKSIGFILIGTNDLKVFRN